MLIKGLRLQAFYVILKEVVNFRLIFRRVGIVHSSTFVVIQFKK